jgi:hypothetical protein
VRTNLPRIGRLKISLGAALAVACVALALGTVQPLSPAQAEPLIFASPVHAGCYWSVKDVCKIHVEPFTLDLTSGSKLVQFQLVAARLRGGASSVIYDFRPDLSNPVPYSGNTYTPSLVTKDFGAKCGETYSVSLQGQNTGDASIFNLGTTGQFTCPAGLQVIRLPLIRR